MLKFKTFSTNHFTSARIISTLVFGAPILLLAALLASPTFDPTPVSADADTDRTNLSFTAAPSLSLSVTGDSELSVEPTDSTQLYTASTSLSATTNSASGCILRIAAADDATTSLVNSGASSSIPTLASAVTIDSTASNFDVNRWGYHSSAEATGLYRPVPANASPATVNSSAAAGTYSTTVTFGVKANTANPAGDYTTRVVFSLVVGS